MNYTGNYNKKVYVEDRAFGADIEHNPKTVRSSTLGNFADYGITLKIRDRGYVTTGKKLVYNNNSYLIVNHTSDRGLNTLICARHDFELVTVTRTVQSTGKIVTTNAVEVGTYEAVITQLYQGYVVDKNDYTNDIQYVLILPKEADIKAGDSVYSGYVTRVLNKEYTTEILVSVKGA